MPRWQASSMKCAPLSADFGEQHAVVGEDRHRHAPDMREAAHQRRAVERLELVELAAVDEPGDHLVHVVGRAHVLGDDRIEFFGVELRRSRLRQVQLARLWSAPRCETISRRMVSACSSFSATWSATPDFLRVQLAAAQVLGADLLAGGGLHQRRAGEEDRALVAHDHALVAHRRDIGAAGGARAHHAGDLRDPQRAHLRLVEEDPPEVVAVGKHLGLVRQVGPAAVDQVEARQPVLARDLLRAQVLLDRQRVVGAALHRRVVGDDHALPARDAPDPGDHPRAGHLVVVEPVGDQLADLEERRARIEQPLDPLPRQQLAARGMPLAARRGPAERGLRDLRPAVPPPTRGCARRTSARLRLLRESSALERTGALTNLERSDACSFAMPSHRGSSQPPVPRSEPHEPLRCRSSRDRCSRHIASSPFDVAVHPELVDQPNGLTTNRRVLMLR